jgi:hypothetical protein
MIKMIKPHLLVIIFFITLSFLPLVSAEIKIEINAKELFSLGESVHFNYTLTSSNFTEVTFIPYIYCPNAPMAVVNEEQILLHPNIAHKGNYNYIPIVNEIEPQTCTAYIQILSPIQKRFEKNFSIVTSPSFEFDVLLDKKIYVKNDMINISYNSEFRTLQITSFLSYPDNTTKQITLPYSFKAEQIGTYNLDTTASKEGYKNVSTSTQFGVIAHEANISYSEPGKKNESSSTGFNLVDFIVLDAVILIGLAAATILYLYRREKKRTLNSRTFLNNEYGFVKNQMKSFTHVRCSYPRYFMTSSSLMSAKRS